MDFTNIGFLFDLDGVLIDTHDLHWTAWLHMRDKYQALASMQYKDFKDGFGLSNESYLQKCAPKSSQDERILWGEEKEAYFRKLAENKITFLPGVESLLREIRAAKMPMIIASSSPISNMDFFLQKTPLGIYFSTYTSADHVVSGKPAPDIFLEAARRIAIPVESTIILEDSFAGLQAARCAGGFVVALATTHLRSELQAFADFDLLLSPEQLSLPVIVFAFTKSKRRSGQEVLNL